MALSQDLVGTHYRYPDHYVVEREKIREHAESVKSEHPAHHHEAGASALGYDSLVAAPTFLCIFGYTAQVAFFEDANILLKDEKIVQVDQELRMLRPIKAGDTLYCDVYVHSIRRSFGADIVVTKSLITNDKGELVQEMFTTLAGRTADDGEEGGFN
ncbi:(3R)-hydroxyacyl-ACP dehydratase subunit HadA [Mycobacterium sp. NPDC050853]|uniref:(3R)-hydroxyacyl-ACP dehydratase subunit HadA n=1 Tax=Mycobacteriaceae TaxID=1762 RepID=UPI0015DF0501|nr:(3R)-hydroxyacyl-ACP dehydratase subunit HadA [Mycobacteroides sp. LB1]